jgi:hypothetical protein
MKTKLDDFKLWKSKLSQNNNHTGKPMETSNPSVMSSNVGVLGSRERPTQQKMKTKLNQKKQEIEAEIEREDKSELIIQLAKNQDYVKLKDLLEAVLILDVKRQAQLTQINEDISEFDDFIKKLKEKIKKEHEDWENNWGADLISLEIIDKLAGEKLT